MPRTFRPNLRTPKIIDPPRNRAWGVYLMVKNFLEVDGAAATNPRTDKTAGPLRSKKFFELSRTAAKALTKAILSRNRSRH